MGCCFSSDSVPDLPEEIRNDPGMSPLLVQVAALGMFGGSRDFGIWENSRPSNGDDQKKKVWLWFNKSDVGPNKVRIDLENFKRGHLPDKPDKGKVLFYSVMDEKPNFQFFSRCAGSGRDSFFGFFQTGYADPEDAYYVNHPIHNKLPHYHVEGHVITKWHANTRADFYDGDAGRGADIMKGDPVVLEMYAKGTNVTTYTAHRNNEGHMQHSHFTTELVDRIEYRLTFRGALWAQWFVQGDAQTASEADPTIDCPLFCTTLNGGWFSRATFTTQTKGEVDPALALLISHVCATEFSVAQVKKDMNIPMPERYPGGGLLGNGLAGLALMFAAPPTTGQWTYQGTSRV